MQLWVPLSASFCSQNQIPDAVRGVSLLCWTEHWNQSAGKQEGVAESGIIFFPTWTADGNRQKHDNNLQVKTLTAEVAAYLRSTCTMLFGLTLLRTIPNLHLQ